LPKNIAPFQRFEGRYKQGRHVRITADMMHSDAWSALKAHARMVYLHMKQKYNGQDEFFRFTYDEAWKTMKLNDQTYKRAKARLIELGFISVAENNRHRMRANVYRFSSKWQNYKKKKQSTI